MGIISAINCQTLQTTPDEHDLSLVKSSTTPASASNHIELHLLSISLLSEINLLRTSPCNYIQCIDDYKNRVCYNPTNKSYYLQATASIQIPMQNGISAIEKCIAFLKKESPSLPVKLDDSLSIKEKATEEIIKAKFEEIQRKGRLIPLSFHCDRNAKNGEVSAICQVIDDEKGSDGRMERRMNILNKEATHIGITVIDEGDGMVCFNVIFAKRLKG